MIRISVTSACGWAAPTVCVLLASRAHAQPPAPPAAALPDKLLLRLHLKPGMSFDYFVVKDVKQTEISAGRKTSSAETEMTLMRMKVAAVAPDGTATLALFYRDAREALPASQKRDSADEEPMELMEFQKAILG